MSFKLEGSANDIPKSTVIEKAERKERYKPKNRQLFLIILCLLLVGLVVYQQFLLYNSQKTISEAKEIKSKSVETEAKAKRFLVLLDSLTVENKRLQKDVDLLAENSERTDGIFFEVQLGSFKDFNLDQYLDELAALRQVKRDGTNKLILGKFRSFKKALQFENDMKRLGLDEAFILGRVDGEVMSYAEALREYRKRKSGK